MFTPTFDSTAFICKDCGKTFYGKECDKRPAEQIPMFSQFPKHPKCPHCGSRKTEKDQAVCY